MPSSTQAKSGESKFQPKQAASKKASKPQAVQDAKSAPRSAQSVEPSLVGNDSFEQATDIPDLAASASRQGSNEVGNVVVNKKKQKRRQKQAARRAAGESQDVGDGSEPDLDYPSIDSNGYLGESDYDNQRNSDIADGEDIYRPDTADRTYQHHYSVPQMNGHAMADNVAQASSGSKTKKKKKSKANALVKNDYSAASVTLERAPQPHPPPSTLDQSVSHKKGHHNSKDRIWNTSTAEERERIKEFWLSLGEDERRGLVKVEKDAVLKKMKEQQKHSCSCTVCGRKRTAIEEELEVLYDAYYEELEQYAHVDASPDGHSNGTRITAPPQMYSNSTARLPPDGRPPAFRRQSSRGRIHELGDDEEGGDEDDFSDEEYDEDISQDDLPEEPRAEAVDFFNFGKNLTVQGGILTVADDLLKNDGKKFIEMMEQLAERRMQREEEQQYAAAGLGPGHNHDPSQDDDGYEEEDDDEYDSQEDEDYEEDDEMEQLTEKQRMDEGRRMFQIFAARMFEQRVLTAYREKVALERQNKLLEELDDESREGAEREAKRARETQKKKDKKRQQKQAKDEERTRREAEKAALQAASKALAEKQMESERQEREEKRRKKDAEKKAQEEEKQRKEAEKQKKLQEAKDQQAEQERKQREAKDREKKKREEMKRKEREERETKEKEARGKREREAAEKREREAKVQADKEAKDQREREVLSAKQSAPKRSSPIPALSGTTALPSNLQPPITTSSHASPRLPVATPILPKAPTPGRNRQASFQESNITSPKTSHPPYSSSTTSPSDSAAHQNSGAPSSNKSNIQPSFQYPQNPPPGLSPGHITHPPGLSGLPSASASTTAFHTVFAAPISPLTQQPPQNLAPFPNSGPTGANQMRNQGVAGGMPFPPGMHGSRHMPQALDKMVNTSMPRTSPPGLNSPDFGHFGVPRDKAPSQSHSRNTSTSYDRFGLDSALPSGQSQPISRPIASTRRAPSTTPQQQYDKASSPSADIDEITNHLGSKALLDGTEDAPEPARGVAPGAPGSGSIGRSIGSQVASGFSDPIGTSRMDNPPYGMPIGNGNSWGSQQSPFGQPPIPGGPSWSSAPGFGRPTNSFFGSVNGPSRPTVSRPVQIRMLIRDVCESLTSRSSLNLQGDWHRAEDVLREVQSRMPQQERPDYNEFIAICDTEGNAQNGGGSISTRKQPGMGVFVQFEAGRNTSVGGRSVPGEIGSPVVGSGQPAIGGQRSFQQTGGF